MEELEIKVILIMGCILLFYGVSLIFSGMNLGLIDFIIDIVGLIPEAIQYKKEKKQFKDTERYQEGVRIKKFLEETNTKETVVINTHYEYFEVLNDLIYSLKNVCDCDEKPIIEDLKFILKEIRKKESLSMNEQLFNTWLLEIACIKYHGLNEAKLNQDQTEILFLIKKVFKEEKEERERIETQKELQKKEEIEQSITNANKQLLNQIRSNQIVKLDKNNDENR